MVGVQLIGKESVIAAFEAVDAEAWALLQGRQLIVSGEGIDELSAWLERFTKTRSAAVYTLRVYDTDSAPDSLTVGTNYIASFNFKIEDTYEGAGIAGYSNKLAARVEELEKKLQGSEGDEEPDIMSSIMGWLNEPHKLQQAVGAFKMLFGNMTAAAPVPAAQAVSGFTGKPQSQEESLQRVAAALDRLERADPDIVPHLEKLADIAEKKPDTFKFLIGNLNAF